MALSLSRYAAETQRYQNSLGRMLHVEAGILASLLPRRHTWRDQARDARGRFGGVTEASCQEPKCFRHTRIVVQRRSGLDR